MAISIRYYVVSEDGPLRHVPHRVSNGLHIGEDAVPEFAGTRQRVIQVVLENENGKPARILDARGSYWFFDDGGNLDLDDAMSSLRWMDAFPEKHRGKVVDLRPGIERKKWKQRHTWDVTAEDLDRVAVTVWPFAADPADNTLKAIKGTAKKPPPLTDAGEEALSTIQSKIDRIKFTLEELSEPALKGLAFALRRSARVYQGESAFYEIAAVEADRQREIRARYRTGKGAWYAELQVWKWNETRSQGREIRTIEERHRTKPEAIEAARRLLAENAHLYDIDISLDAQVISELEWVSMKRKGDGDDE